MFRTTDSMIMDYSSKRIYKRIAVEGDEIFHLFADAGVDDGGLEFGGDGEGSPHSVGVIPKGTSKGNGCSSAVPSGLTLALRTQGRLFLG